MNITDLIVELLQQGKQVELPEMGTFGSEMQPPYHDAATGTYYPSRRTLTFTTATSGDESIVQALAKRECVGESVARQMWKNYIDALSDKLKRTGSHNFGELGTLNYSDGQGYSFASTPGMALSTGDEKPLEGVKTYVHNDNEDPFAQFEDDGAEKARQEAERKAEEERLAAERKAAEERLAAERKAEEERLAAERKAEEERLAAERKAEEERLAAERKAEEERLAAERKAEEERLAAERKAEEERLAEEAREAEKRTEEERMAAEAAALAALGATTGEAAAQEMPKADLVDKGSQKAKKVKKEKKEKKAKVKEEKKVEKKEKKKKRFPWWILLLLLLLLLGAAAAYYFLKIRGNDTPADAMPRTSIPLGEVPVVTDLTYNTDLLEYSQRDIDMNSDMVCRYMTDYIYSFLAYRNYADAMEPMMERVRQYAGERLGTLMADRFAVQRLYPFNDYIYKYNEEHLRDIFAQHQRCTVQGELLNMRTLDGILDKMVNELGLEPGAAVPQTAEAQSAVAKAAAKPAATATTEEAPIHVNMEQDSKQGFDIIAGFYLDRATAARLTARLHELGSDAYIIEKNNMYYVSMGSAKNRTAAEALFKHIKSWYDGDIAIKQW